ncbi:uncharacterized protein MELLADRAFT_71976 [Melampsora larici-populina 98AG31]|uniref:CxC1-like cysteine cluster associated with KDZ transposases domain-containing protein n=1 Tax=Melampsora larici-populina (strain 98AG31 / pathotype 3-4-7) TaxID=747676 RepID=F4RN43_MELLP|nr:uncharacterized protein MELLADRAFT_71976 [Melampsora larici-populina 98AG31]EGG06234.1 hypothetical protein MELLADRAFT_71976 [Melampsora larici-populina 98AG31]
MGTSGRSIPCIGSQHKPKRQRADTQATIEKAERDQAQKEWGQRKCESISHALNDPSRNSEHTANLDPINQQQEAPEIMHNDFNYSGFPDEDERDQELFQDLGQESDQEEMHTYVRYFSRDTYKHQKIQEDIHWKSTMQRVFIAFMKAVKQTSNGGDHSLWDHNFNTVEICSCGPSRKRTRLVDTVDLLYRRQLKVEFCSCTPDQVRLLNQGYFGASPKTPETAFSLRLLRLYHLAWKYCHSNIQPFSLMIDEFLDAFNPQLLVPGTYEPRLWRKPLASAVYYYRQILKMIEDLEAQSLNLTPLEKLACNCPRCFGPAGCSPIKKGPQYIVCVDDEVARWEPQQSGNGRTEVPLDPCTTQHTAAEDRRDGSSWRGSEETGLIGLACRHDHMLKIVNVIRSGEK